MKVQGQQHPSFPGSSGLEPKAPQELQLCSSQATCGGLLPQRIPSHAPQQGWVAGRALPEQRAGMCVVTPDRCLCHTRGSAAPIPLWGPGEARRGWQHKRGIPPVPPLRSHSLPALRCWAPAEARPGWELSEVGRKRTGQERGGGSCRVSPGHGRGGRRAAGETEGMKQPELISSSVRTKQGWSHRKTADGASALMLCRNLRQEHLPSPQGTCGQAQRGQSGQEP